jgi:transcription elongation factor GreA
MDKFIVFTQGGFDKIQHEKEALLEKRKVAVLELKNAREMGDLSENAAYKVARATLSSIDSRLRHLSKLIRYGRIAKAPNTGKIGIGSKVLLVSNGKNIEYEIVGSYESNPTKGTISHVSPLGRVLMGKEAGEAVHVVTPNGDVTYEVINVSIAQ